MKEDKELLGILRGFAGQGGLSKTATAAFAAIREDGAIVSTGSGACHGELRTAKYGEGPSPLRFYVTQLQNQSIWADKKEKEASARKYLEMFLKRSPFSDMIINDDVDDMINTGVLVDLSKAYRNQVAFLSVAMRVLHEHTSCVTSAWRYMVEGAGLPEWFAFGMLGNIDGIEAIESNSSLRGKEQHYAVSLRRITGHHPFATNVAEAGLSMLAKEVLNDPDKAGDVSATESLKYTAMTAGAVQVDLSASCAVYKFITKHKKGVTVGGANFENLNPFKDQPPVRKITTLDWDGIKEEIERLKKQ